MTTDTLPGIEPAPPAAQPNDGLTAAERAHFEATAQPLDEHAPWPAVAPQQATPKAIEINGLRADLAPQQAAPSVWMPQWFARLVS